MDRRSWRRVKVLAAPRTVVGVRAVPVSSPHAGFVHTLLLLVTALLMRMRLLRTMGALGLVLLLAAQAVYAGVAAPHAVASETGAPTPPAAAADLRILGSTTLPDLVPSTEQQVNALLEGSHAPPLFQATTHELGDGHMRRLGYWDLPPGRFHDQGCAIGGVQQAGVCVQSRHMADAVAALEADGVDMLCKNIPYSTCLSADTATTAAILDAEEGQRSTLLPALDAGTAAGDAYADYFKTRVAHVDALAKAAFGEGYPEGRTYAATDDMFGQCQAAWARVVCASFFPQCDYTYGMTLGLCMDTCAAAEFLCGGQQPESHACTYETVPGLSRYNGFGGESYEIPDEDPATTDHRADYSDADVCTKGAKQTIDGITTNDISGANSLRVSGRPGAAAAQAIPVAAAALAVSAMSRVATVATQRARVGMFAGELPTAVATICVVLVALTGTAAAGPVKAELPLFVPDDAGDVAMYDGLCSSFEESGGQLVVIIVPCSVVFIIGVVVLFCSRRWANKLERMYAADASHRDPFQGKVPLESTIKRVVGDVKARKQASLQRERGEEAAMRSMRKYMSVREYHEISSVRAIVHRQRIAAEASWLHPPAARADPRHLKSEIEAAQRWAKALETHEQRSEGAPRHDEGGVKEAVVPGAAEAKPSTNSAAAAPDAFAARANDAPAPPATTATRNTAGVGATGAASGGGAAAASGDAAAMAQVPSPRASMSASQRMAASAAWSSTRGVRAAQGALGTGQGVAHGPHGRHKHAAPRRAAVGGVSVATSEAVMAFQRRLRGCWGYLCGSLCVLVPSLTLYVLALAGFNFEGTGHSFCCDRDVATINVADAFSGLATVDAHTCMTASTYQAPLAGYGIAAMNVECPSPLIEAETWESPFGGNATRSTWQLSAGSSAAEVRQHLFCPTVDYQQATDDVPVRWFEGCALGGVRDAGLCSGVDISSATPFCRVAHHERASRVDGSPFAPDTCIKRPVGSSRVLGDPEPNNGLSGEDLRASARVTDAMVERIVSRGIGVWAWGKDHSEFSGKCMAAYKSFWCDAFFPRCSERGADAPHGQQLSVPVCPSRLKQVITECVGTSLPESSSRATYLYTLDSSDIGFGAEHGPFGDAVSTYLQGVVAQAGAPDVQRGGDRPSFRDDAEIDCMGRVD